MSLAPAAGGGALVRATRRLQASLPEDRVLVHPDRLATYQSDGLLHYRVPPGVVVLPDSAEEVRLAVRILAEEGVPVVARGSGTGLSGGRFRSRAAP